MTDDGLHIALNRILYDKEFCDRLAARMIKIISSGPSEGNETIIDVTGHRFTRHQIERFKKAFIFLVSHDEEFRCSMRKVFRRYLDKPVANPLNKAQMEKRIIEFGALTFKYRGKMCGFYAEELYSVFGEYSRKQVMQMLMDNELWVRSCYRIHPKTGKNCRAHILNI